MKFLLLLSLSCSFALTSLKAQTLIEAVDSRDLPKTAALLRSGAKVSMVDAKGSFPLWTAVWNEDTAMVRLLFANGADANQPFRNKDGVSLYCIEIASQNGSFDIVQMLVDHGARSNAPGYAGQTPLRIAARNGHLEIVKYLVAKGADIDLQANDKATPLEAAAGKGHMDIVIVLVEAGANVNHRDKDGDTPLHEAARGGYLEVTQYLLSKGADQTVKDNEGSTAADIAKASGQPRLEKLLKEYKK